MDAVLDEDAAALGPVPEPVLGRQVLVGRVVLERRVQQLAKRLGLDQAAHGVEDRVVALHEVGDEQHVARTRQRDHLVGLFEREGERLLADHVLAGFKRQQRVRVVQERGCGDVDEVTGMRVTIAGWPIKWVGGDGSMVRMVAIVDEGDQ